MRDLPGAHATRREGSYVVLVVDAADANDVTLVSWIVQRAIQGPVIADGRDHYYIICGEFPHLRS